MRNILVIDFDNNQLGYTNEGCCDRNKIELQFKTSIEYNTIQLTKQDGTIIDLTGNELPFDIYKAQGELKLRLVGTSTTTTDVTFCIPNDLESTDNIIVKVDSGKYVIRKVNEQSGETTTTDHAQLLHLDYESSGHTGFASTEEVNQRVKESEIATVAKTGNYIDLKGSPTALTNLEIDDILNN